MIAFDWYQGTIPQPLDDVLEALAGLADGLKVSHTRGAHGYAHTAILGSEATGKVASVMHGGSHEYPHAIVTSEWAQPGAEIIRAAFPQHTVSRVDVREDYGDAEAYERIQAQLLSVAERYRVRVGTAGDHLLRMKGRTCYLGATSSAVRVRLYDKAAELRSKLPQRSSPSLCEVAWGKKFGVPEHLTRLEAQIRPQTRQSKAQFAVLEPVQALGSAAWLREVWAQVEGLSLEPVQVGQAWRPDDHERAYGFMLKQYRKVFLRLLAEAGSWECVGLQIGQDLADT